MLKFLKLIINESFIIRRSCGFYLDLLLMIDVRPGHKSERERLVNIHKCIDSYLLLKEEQPCVDY